MATIKPSSVIIKIPDRKLKPQHIRARAALTYREVQIMVLLLDSLNNRAKMCSILGISYGTYRNHLNSIYSKLGALNRYHAVCLFINTEGYKKYGEYLKQRPKTIFELDDPEIRNRLDLIVSSQAA